MHCRPLLPQQRHYSSAKPTVNAEALLQHFAAHGCGVTDVDAHTRFAFVQFESDADASRALALENGPYREAKRAHASINDRNATAAAAWDALCAKLRDVTAGAVVPRSMRTASRRGLAARGHETLAVEQVGVERLLLLRSRDPAAFAAETSADAVLAGVCVPLALNGATPVADVPYGVVASMASVGHRITHTGRRCRGATRRLSPRRLRGRQYAGPRPHVSSGAGGGDHATPRGRDGVRSRSGPSRPRSSRRGRRPGVRLRRRLQRRTGSRRARKQVASRAYFKLEEALDLAGVEDLGGKRALDLGAAPGGWTECLLDRGASVVAVDPGALDDAVARRPGVRHIQKKSQAARNDGDLGR